MDFGIRSFIKLMILFLCGCETGFTLDPVHDPLEIKPDQFRLEMVSGNHQSYIGYSKEPIKFRVYNNTRNRYQETLYFTFSGIKMVARGDQGSYVHFEDPGGNYSLRNMNEQCQCYEFYWYLMPSDDPILGGAQIDSVNIEISIYYTQTGKDIINSPKQYTHYPEE